MGALRLFISIFVLSVVAFANEPYQFVRISSKHLDKELFEQHGFIRDHKSHRDYVFGYLPKSKVTMEVVSKYHVLTLDEKALRSVDFDAVTLEPKKLEHGFADEGTYEAYHTYATLTSELKTLSETYPKLAKLESVGKSVEGRELWLMRLTASEVKRESRPKLLYISSMHGDEVTGKEMMIYFLRKLLKGYGTDQRVTALLDNAELFIIPSMNPDGTEAGQRWNANNVDLNRNFPKMNEPEFSTKGREPETVALMEFHRKHHFAVSMNFHGGEICVNIPWDHRSNQKSEDMFGDNELMVSLANEYASHNRPMYDNHQASFNHGVTYGYEWFQILGGMQDWSSFFRQSLHSTLEISVTKWPSANQLPQFWKDNEESIMRYFEAAMVGYHLKVVDTFGKPVNATVSMETAERALNFPDGFVHRPSVAKNRKLVVSAQGFMSVSLNLTPWSYDGKSELVVMKPMK